MELKKKLAIKNRMKKHEGKMSGFTFSDLDQSYEDGFDKAKSFYIDYAKRFLKDEKVLKDFELIGKMTFADYDKPLESE